MGLENFHGSPRDKHEHVITENEDGAFDVDTNLVDEITKTEETLNKLREQAEEIGVLQDILDDESGKYTDHNKAIAQRILRRNYGIDSIHTLH